jgi:hypothetical protein
MRVSGAKGARCAAACADVACGGSERAPTKVLTARKIGKMAARPRAAQAQRQRSLAWRSVATLHPARRTRPRATRAPPRH